MGKYVNPGNSAFAIIAGDETYVDKSGLIEFTNSRIGKMRPLICFSRPRRFGKSIAAHMLTAYYSRGCNSGEIFSGLKIAESSSFERELNKNTVIYLDMQEMRSIAKSENNTAEVVSYMQIEVIKELREEFPDILDENERVLSRALGTVFQKTGERFIVIIDEWDCLFREEKNNEEIQDKYVNFLRGMFKGGSADAFIKLAYITGILPIKKYGTQSAEFKELTKHFEIAKRDGINSPSVELAIKLLENSGAIECAQEKGIKFITDSCKAFKEIFGDNNGAEKINTLFTSMIPAIIKKGWFMFVDFEDQLSDPFGCTYLSLLDESERDLISIKKN